MRRHQEQPEQDREPYDFYKPVEQEPVTFWGELRKLKKMGLPRWDGVHLE